MSTQRKELVRILSLLNDQLEPAGAEVRDDVSDLELLRAIVERVKDWKKQKPIGESLALDEAARVLLASNTEEAQERFWKPLDKFDDQLRRDYTCRKQMIMTRLDCTVESFKWKGSDGHEPKGGNAKSKNEQIHGTYEKARLVMKEEPQIGLAHLLAAREADCDRLLNHVVSGSRKNDCKIRYGDKSKELVNLKQVIMPHVPDRGGRPDEVRPPPKETLHRAHRGGFRGRRR